MNDGAEELLAGLLVVIAVVIGLAILTGTDHAYPEPAPRVTTPWHEVEPVEPAR